MIEKKKHPKNSFSKNWAEEKNPWELISRSRKRGKSEKKLK